MNDCEPGPLWLALAQPVVNPLAGIRTGRVGVPSRWFVNHQQMLIFEYDARQHAEMKAQFPAMVDQGLLAECRIAANWPAAILLLCCRQWLNGSYASVCCAANRESNGCVQHRLP